MPFLRLYRTNVLAVIPQHAMATLLRQSIYSRLAGYEDVNDAERLSVDPVMRAITGKKAPNKQAASVNTMGRFETKILTQHENLGNLSDINGKWVRKAVERRGVDPLRS